MPPPAFAGINGTAFSIVIPSAEAAAQAGAVAGAVPVVLIMVGDFLFNYSSFKNDWNRLQEDMKQAEKAGGETESGDSKSAKKLIGHEFEEYLVDEMGGEGSFKVGGREFDGRVGNRWWEAKSGGYWDLLENNPSMLD